MTLLPSNPWPARLLKGLLPSLVALPLVCEAVTRTDGIGDDRNSLEVVPELRWAGSSGAARLSGLLQSTGSGAWTLNPGLLALKRRPISGNLLASVYVDAATLRWPGLGPTGRLEALGALTFGSGPRAVWGGAGAARVRKGHEWSTSGVVQAGASLRVGRTRLNLTTQTSSYSNAFAFLDTVFTPGDSLPPQIREFSGRTNHSYTDAALEALWQGERMGLGIDFNLRLGRRLSEPRASARATASYRVSPRVTLLARGGREPSIPDQGVPSREFASMALQFDLQDTGWQSPLLCGVEEPAKPSFSIESLGGLRRRIRIRLPEAETVELAGDFSDWIPVVLRKRGWDHWETECSIAPGPHRVNVRIDDGSWTVPPGLQAVRDEFNGIVGVFLVR